MGAYIKPIRKIISKTGEIAFSQLDKELIELEIHRDQFVQELNHKAALKYARILGLKPINDSVGIRELLNQRIICEVKSRKLRHIDMAAATQMPRTRITAIMNRRLERVSIDCLIQILNILGIQTEIFLKSSDVY